MQTPLHVLAHKHLRQPRGVRIEVAAQCLGDEPIKIGRATLGDKHPRIVDQLLRQLGVDLGFHGARIGEQPPQQNRKTPRSNAALSTSHRLGLAIVKHLVESQAGTVGAEFPAAGGSVFWFELPAR